MIRKIKDWLYGRFLPAWCRDDLLDANKRLLAKADAQAQEIKQLNVYIDGMESAMRSQARVIINCKEVSAHEPADSAAG